MNGAWHVYLDGQPRVATADEARRLHADGVLNDDSWVMPMGARAWQAYRDSALAIADDPSATPADAFVAIFSARQSIAQPPGLEVSDEGWQDVTPAPWRRYFARQMDILVFGTLIWMGAAFVTAATDPVLYETLFASEITDNLVVSTLLTYFVVIPVLVVLTGLTGSSLGKWVFGVRVTRRDGRPIGLRAGLKREATIYLFGMGLALPLLSLVTLLVARSRLVSSGVTTWDQDEDWVVTHRGSSPLQTLAFVGGVVAFVVAALYLRLSG